METTARILEPETPNFLSVDFYCGAGGSTRGLLDANGYVICGIDNDENNRITYQQNNRNTTLDKGGPTFFSLDMFPKCSEFPHGQQQDVWDNLQDLIPRYRSASPGTPLLFVICAPCQPFTPFVQRRMTEHRIQDRSRNLNLLWQTVNLIEEFEPELVISENVPQIKTGRHRIVWNSFMDKLRTLNYVVGENIICASRFGVPQHRRRIVLIAHKIVRKEELFFDLSVPVHDPTTSQISVREAIGHLPRLQAGEESKQYFNHICAGLTQKNRQRLMSVKPGDSNLELLDTPFGDLSLPCHRRLAQKGKKGFSDSYTRIHPDRPAPTLTTKFLNVSNGRYGHFDEQQVRGLSLREGAILQSFENNYVFHGHSLGSIAKMIGNAVPPKLMKYIAKNLLHLWNEHNAHSVRNSKGK